MRAPAFAPGEGRAGDQQRRRQHVLRLRACRLPAQAVDRGQRARKPRAVAHDADIGRHDVAQFLDDGVIMTS